LGSRNIPNASAKVQQHQVLRLLALSCIFGFTSSCNGDSKGQFTPDEIQLKTQGEFMELQSDRLIFRDTNGNEWVAPKGTLTDGASVPRLALPITDDRFNRTFLKAAVVHDAYCQEDNQTRTPNQYRKKPWKAVHRMFYDGMLAGKTNLPTAQIMYAAVYLLGPRWDDPLRDLRQVSKGNLTRGFTGAKQWIERNQPTVAQLEAEIERREPVLRRLNTLENGITAAVQRKKTDEGQELVQQEESLLNEELAKSPDDVMLLNFKGDLHKNRAELYRISSRTSEANSELSRSEEMFHAVLKAEPKDPSALSGLGSVAALRHDREGAEKYLERAIAVAPSYEPAKIELQRLREGTPPH
jgi:tetratricopeptide (TPR) repeat protein